MPIVSSSFRTTTTGNVMMMLRAVLCSLLLLLAALSVDAFVIRTATTSITAASSPTSSSALSMVLEKPATKKKLSKLEELKISSEHLLHPLDSQLRTEEISVSKDAYQILKYHGSYQQSNREAKKGVKDFQFMLRLKQPSGELPPELYRLVDDLSRQYGQGDLRATTRQCFQIHGILKGSLKTVISSIMNIGSSTIGACGDVSRNVMTTPAPFATPEYRYSREYGKVFAQLFRPMTPAFSEIWLDGEKAASVETWSKEIKAANHDVDSAMLYDSGRGIVLPDTVEPIYGDRYLPRKFKIGVTVPGDNSLDLYTNDIGVVVICNQQTGELEGFNVMVGGGMGRTHNKETTFARAADHLGFVPPQDIMELLKSIVASQRDHGNRDVRANARMKYLVHTLGISNFKKLVESYFGKEIQPWRPIADWKYNDWMGWWEQGDGKLFYGLHVNNGRVKDEGNFRLKSALRVLVDKYNLSMILSPTQSIIFRDINPADKDGIEAVLAEHGLEPIENVDPLARLSMACPALPLCGLAQTEAERKAPDYLERIRGVLNKKGLSGLEMVIRVTGCPNGCARPYMAELGLVGDGPKSYQIWLGGSPVLTRTAFPYQSKMKIDDLEKTLDPILDMYVQQRQDPHEAFGDFCHRVGATAIEQYVSSKQ